MPGPSPAASRRWAPRRGMPLAAPRKPAAARFPRVVTYELGRALRLEGRRLGLLGRTALHVRCSCGHADLVSVADLVATHGGETRVRDAVRSIRCGSCRKRQIKKIRWLA